MPSLTLLGVLGGMLGAGIAGVLVYYKKGLAAALMAGVVALILCNVIFFGLLAIALANSNM